MLSKCWMARASAHRLQLSLQVDLDLSRFLIGESLVLPRMNRIGSTLRQENFGWSYQLNERLIRGCRYAALNSRMWDINGNNCIGSVTECAGENSPSPGAAPFARAPGRASLAQKAVMDACSMLHKIVEGDPVMCEHKPSAGP